jgi:hypothetical protein
MRYQEVACGDAATGVSRLIRSRKQPTGGEVSQAGTPGHAAANPGRA